MPEPMRREDAASIRCVSAYLVKLSRDGSANWELLEYMGIAQSLPAAYKNTSTGHAPPTVCRLRHHVGVGRFVSIDLGGANEEYVQVLAVDPDSQTVDAIVTGDHLAGENVRPAIWPTPILNEGDDLAFDILSVASPDAGSDLTVVIQT